MKVTVTCVQEFGKSGSAGPLLCNFAPALFLPLRTLCSLPFMLFLFALALLLFAPALFFEKQRLVIGGLFGHGDNGRTSRWVR
jgi:hypothetical protein